jgi:hypothetical protein
MAEPPVGSSHLRLYRLEHRIDGIAWSISGHFDDFCVIARTLEEAGAPGELTVVDVRTGRELKCRRLSNDIDPPSRVETRRAERLLDERLSTN